MSRRDRIVTLRRWCLNLHADAFSKSVLHVLIQYVDGNDHCYPAISRIAIEAGMSLRKARSVIRALELAGHLIVSHSAGRSSNHYTLISDPAQRAALEPPNPAHKVGLNPAQCAALENVNPAPEVSQPGTVCRLLVKNGIKSAGQGEDVPSGDAVPVREVAS